MFFPIISTLLVKSGELSIVQFEKIPRAKLFFEKIFVSTEISTYLCGKINQVNMRTANYTELRKNLKVYLDSVIDDCEPLIVNRSGNNGVVIISLDEYNAIRETEYIMSSPQTMSAIRKAENELKQGETYSQNPNESVTAFLERMSCIE